MINKKLWKRNLKGQRNLIEGLKRSSQLMCVYLKVWSRKWRNYSPRFIDFPEFFHSLKKSKEILSRKANRYLKSLQLSLSLDCPSFHQLPEEFVHKNNLSKAIKFYGKVNSKGDLKTLKCFSNNFLCFQFYVEIFFKDSFSGRQKK